MKVIYQKRITDKIKEEIEKATRINRKIDRIELTEKEWTQFKTEVVVWTTHGIRSVTKANANYEGVDIYVIDEF